MINLNQKNYLQSTGLLFAVGAIVHLLRILIGWQASIAGWDVPVWLSFVVVVAAGYLAYSAYNLMK